MGFDSLVANPGRLRILTALAAAPKQPFVQLRRQTGLTDGNLATHARRLKAAGLIDIEKSVEAGKALTTLNLTAEGRDALTRHVEQLTAALRTAVVSEPASGDDDWVD
jgi:DNA-binding MarR family transcriptional regulator